ncbi:MAG: UvrD-helicase domain-containing protein [Oscillospiraceae bacterium]|nr:UvrD-helicase domain-containing protein [Oscillospiraceae bacterium]
MANWTNQQLDAITARDRSIIVSAAAGSGKTAVLVERLVRILSETSEDRRVSADQIAVVTFTNDAAAQMKQRLSAALSAKITETAASGDESAHAYLLEQRMKLSAAKISTIHSFCFDLIRENADVLGISPQFTIAEPAQEAIYQQRALDRAIERWSSERPEMATLFRYFCAKDDSDLESLVLEIADFMGSLAFPKIWAANVRAQAADASFLFEQMRTAACRELRSMIAFYEKSRDFADHALTKVDPKKGNAFVRKLETDLAGLRCHLAFLETAAREALCTEPLTRSHTFEKIPGLRSNVDPDAKLAFLQMATIAKERYQDLIEKMLEPMRFFEADAEISVQVVPLLLDLTNDYLDALMAEKMRQNALSFADAEELALQLLCDADDDGTIHRSPLAEELSSQFQLIMVDEYQDTNNKQDCIFKLLSRHMLVTDQGLYYGDNAFLVGDVKQSIYSFRQANPENFRRAISLSKPLSESAEGEMARIFLNQNFRSARGVLHFVNALFFAVMRENCGEVDYNENEQLNFGSPVFHDCMAKTQVLIARESDELPDGANLQAECIASTIHSMIGTAPVYRMDEHGEIVTRPAQAGDFCVLMRSVSSYCAPVIEALRRLGIPVSADEDGGLLALPEIHLIRNLLRCADNPLHDGALAAVMLSPIYGFTAQDLVQLKLVSRRRRVFLKLQELAEMPEAPEEITDLQSRAQAFLSDLYAMQETAVRLPLEDAIWEIYRLTDLLALQSLYDDAEDRRAHLEAFSRLAKGYRDHADLTAESCLSGWLRYLDRLEGAGRDLEVKGGTAGRTAVSVKTIHKSKGLQYPFVFIAYLDHKFSRKPADSPIQASENGLLGVKVHDRQTCLQLQTAAYRHLLSEVYRRQRSEEMRLFYVALTRAEQQLFLVMDRPEGPVTAKTSAGKLGGLLEMKPELVTDLAPVASSMQDWLLYFLLGSCDAQNVQRLMEGEESTGKIAEYRQYLYHQEETEAVPEAFAPTAMPDASVTESMKRQLAFVYETPQSSLVSKFSVTQLAHPETGVTDLMRQPQFKLEGRTGGLANLKGAARGTAVHKVMQLLDFGLAAKNPQEALDQLERSGLVNSSEAASVTAEKLAAFFASDLYARIAVSDRVEREKNLFVQLGALHLPNYPELTEKYKGTDGVLIGTMDLLFHEPDGWVIVDYKTDYATSGTSLLREYSLQLELYRAAAEQILGEPVKELYLYSFALDQALRVNTEGDRT